MNDEPVRPGYVVCLWCKREVPKPSFGLPKVVCVCGCSFEFRLYSENKTASKEKG